MIFKSELTGARLKRDLDLQKAHYRWHNKNKRGGNFGINLRTGNGFLGDGDFELTGSYNTAGLVTSLKFGWLFRVGTQINPTPPFDNYAGLIEILRKRRTDLEKFKEINNES